MLPPLTFEEYINLKGYKDLIIPSSITWKNKLTKYHSTNNLPALNKHFIDYINFGGYPEVIFSDKIRSNFVEKLLDTVSYLILCPQCMTTYL